tara:strand:+ start:7703 stop:8194 length:492 start_codon:yes stop_codon:yes gene_type:complete
MVHSPSAFPVAALPSATIHHQHPHIRHPSSYEEVMQFRILLIGLKIMSNTFVEGMKKSFTIEGRATRREYWVFLLQSFVVAFILGVFSGLLLPQDIGMLVSTVIMILLTPACFCLTIRRIHDTGKSGWWFLLLFIPIVGLLAYLYFVFAGSSEEDTFGEASYT